LKKYTENTITNIEVLKDELKVIKECGYATDKTEHDVGIWCVAAPIFERNKKIIAAISITTPEIYLTDKKNNIKCIETFKIK
jgi:DNA-binding IclR family transcriptional regulator